MNCIPALIRVKSPADKIGTTNIWQTNRAITIYNLLHAQNYAFHFHETKQSAKNLCKINNIFTTEFITSSTNRYHTHTHTHTRILSSLPQAPYRSYLYII